MDENPLQETTSSSNLTFNPFEAESLDSLHLPTFSPSVFSTKKATPLNSRKKPGEFRWSIDQLASLYPADIDENGQQEEQQLDHETEEKVQNTISMFFEEKLHVPSPWSASRSSGKLNAKSPGHPLSKRIVREDSPLVRKELPAKIPQSEPPLPKSGVDAICQTAITLPMDFDLNALLGDKCNLYSEQSSQDQSSLRRKLFALSDTSQSATPESMGSLPQSVDTSDQALSSPHLSPVERDCAPVRQELKTPSSAGSQFSSSPLVAPSSSSLPMVCTPFTPRGPSPCLRDLGTPMLSPICKNSETPRTGKPDKRNQSVSFASKLKFTPSVSSPSPSSRQIQGRRKLVTKTTSNANSAPDHSCLTNTAPKTDDSLSMDDFPQRSSPVQEPCAVNFSIDDSPQRSSPVRKPCVQSLQRLSSNNQVCPQYPEMEAERDSNSRSDFTTSLFGDGDGGYEGEKLTSTQLVGGNSANDLTFDLTMNDADLTAMETSSASVCAPLGLPVGDDSEMKAAPRVEVSAVSRVPAEKLFVTNGMVQESEREGCTPHGLGESGGGTLGQTDSGYNTRSLPTISMTAAAAALVPTADQSESQYYATTLSSTGSLPSLSL